MEFRCYHVYKLRYVYLCLESRHLGFATSAYLLTCDYHQYNIGSMSIFKKTRIAVENSSLASVELKIHCMVCAVHLQGFALPVLSRHIGYMVDARRVLIAPSCSPAIFRKSRPSVPVNS